MKMKSHYINMNLLNKKSFSLIELIVSIFIISLISIYSIYFYKEIFFKNEQLFLDEKTKLELLNFKLFLQKNKNFDKLSFSNQKLYYDDALLLKEVNKYEFISKNDYISINLCLQSRVCQEVVIAK
ncbi:prepilin-type N-terminal cleavage/methylation domain-containing protein [Arcobacter sp.]|uniref:prepilin-type N-terminal cleavage/methylation domain-containing protein n=2 Tax=Arcobacter sp. TaxID=1872629 RepID=UPI003D151C74